MRFAALRVALMLACTLAACLPARAIFHLGSIGEIYTSADGKVQFIEFVALAGGQQFLAGHGLTASGGPDPTRSFVFGGDLPFDTASFTFANADSGAFAYTVNGVSQSKAIERQVYSMPASVCVLAPVPPNGYPP